MDPQMLQAMLAQLSQGGGQPQPQPQAQQDTTDWLTTAINAVHQGMVHDSDPKRVSLLGAILNQLTTYQQQAMAPQGQGSGQ